MKKLCLVIACFAVLLTACGGSKHKAPVVENPYTLRTQDYTHLGVLAMQQERWESAQYAFQRALKSATLANDQALVVRAWYNLAMVQKALKHTQKAEQALHKTEQLAHLHGLKNDELRAKLQLSLLYLSLGQEKTQFPELEASLPVDIYLTAARLAQLQGAYDLSEQTYLRALRVAGKTRSGLLARAESYMGLALLGKAKADAAAVLKYAQKVSTLSRKIGAPRLAAHALLLLAKLENRSLVLRLDDAKRAHEIYHLIHDAKGEQEVKNLLETLSEEQAEK